MPVTSRTIDIAAFLNDRKMSLLNYKHIVLSFIATLLAGQNMANISYAAPYMREDLALDQYMLGNVFSAGLAGMFLGSSLFAYIGDRIGRRPAILAAVTAFGTLTAATAFVRNYEVLLLIRFLNGLPVGGILPVVWALNIEYVPATRRATVATIMAIGYGLGSSLAGPVSVFLTPSFGWQALFLAGGGASLICAAALLWTLPESLRFLVGKGRRPELAARLINCLCPAERANADDDFVLGDERRHDRKFSIGQLFEGNLKWLTILLWSGYFASTLGVMFITTWGPILYESLNLTREDAAYSASLVGILGSALSLLLMGFTDRFGPSAVVFYPLLAVPLLLLIGFFEISPATLPLLLIVSTGLVAGAHLGVSSLLGLFYPTTIRASGAGWTMSVGRIGGVLGAMVGGVLLSSGLPVAYCLAILAICPFLLAMCLLGVGQLVRQTARREALSNAALAT